jgi:hypothetical protein
MQTTVKAVPTKWHRADSTTNQSFQEEADGSRWYGLFGFFLEVHFVVFTNSAMYPAESILSAQN